MANFRPKPRKRTDAKVDAFAGLIAEGWSIRNAALALGVSDMTCWRMLRTIKAGLGDQAR